MDFASQFLATVRRSGSVLLTGPESPDGDSIGACLALRRVLAQLAPGVRVDVAGHPGFRYDWLPGADTLVPDEQVGAYDGVVVMDGDAGRLPRPIEAAFNGAGWTAIVDHHRSTTAEGYTLVYLDGESESTCVMVRQLMRAWGVGLDRDIALLLYTGIIFDTGAFRHSNTRPSTHLLAAELLSFDFPHWLVCEKVLVERRLPGLRLHARVFDQADFLAGGRLAVGRYSLALRDELGTGDGDVEGAVDALCMVQGVEVGAVFVEKADGRTKLSLRSRGGIDVASLAKRISVHGGGHAKAAGASIPGDLAAAMAIAMPALLDACPAREAAGPVPSP
ncbi:MAG: DHH family phosphoesterase [Deltaproteobacteria bacterium]|nr:DHH family phosphoesterase [Deltaproteobacteria bacterium]